MKSYVMFVTILVVLVDGFRNILNPNQQYFKNILQNQAKTEDIVAELDETIALETECDLATEGFLSCNSTHSLPHKSVWTTFGELAMKTGAINLGQGFPDWNPPPFVVEALQQTIETKFHQYTRPAGHPQLVQLIAERYSSHLNRPIDPYDEVAITVGATQALYLALISLLKPGDEVVLFDPYFELYTKQIRLTGATTKFVTMGGASATPADPWAVDLDQLKKSVTEKTKIIILNSPHNPTGKVFTHNEMMNIAEVVRANPQVVVLCDEVYKYSIYDPQERGDPSVEGHFHFARLPGVDRTRHHRPSFILFHIKKTRLP